VNQPQISDLDFTCLLGLPLIPVHIVEDGDCSCEDVQCRSKGKHPRTPRGVHDGRPMAPHELLGSNVGVCCGDGVIVIDVDPRNGGLETLAAIERKHGKMPLTLTCKTGGQGWHYYYRVEREVRKKPNAFGKGIDLQSDGSYCVAPPSVHMSGARYVWTNRIEISQAPDWIFDYLDSRTAPSVIKLNEDFSIYSREDWESMLSKIVLGDGDYSKWIQVCFGMHSLGYAWCFEAFHAWSAGCAGYVSREDCLKHWNSVGKKSTGMMITPASVIHLAYEGGWQWEPQINIQYADENTTDKPSLELDRVQFPNSKFGKICEWYHKTSAYNHPDFAILSAIFSAVPFVQRNYKPALVDNCAIAALMVAPSGNGKGFFINAPFKLVRKYNSRVCVDMTSSALMTRQLVSEFNSRVLFKDEAISQLMRWSKNDFGAEQFETFMSMTSGAYIQGQSFRGAKRVPSLENYSYSFCGNGTLKMYIQLLNTKNFKESGSLSRFIVAISEDKNENSDAIYPSLDTCLPDEYCEFIKWIKEKETVESNNSGSSFSIDLKADSETAVRLVPFGAIGMGEGVSSMVAKFRTDTIAMGKTYNDDFGTEEFFTRAGENALRVANIISVVNNHISPVLTTDVLDWSQGFILGLIKRQAVVFRQNIETSKFDEIKNRVYRSIIRGNKNRRDISRNTRLTGKSLDDCIQSLVSEGMITVEPDGFTVRVDGVFV
jgi:hypothetical protein